MKIDKNFDELREKFKKLPRKYYENLRKKWSVLNICWKSEKISR